jgi:hypothetical protein
MKITSVTQYCLVATTLSSLGFSLALLLERSPPPTGNAVEERKITLKDKLGNARLELEVDDAGNPRIRMSNAEGHELLIDLSQRGGGVRVKTKDGGYAHLNVIGTSADVWVANEKYLALLSSVDHSSTLLLRGTKEYRIDRP